MKKESSKKQGGKNGVLTNLIIMGLFFEVFYFRQFWVQKCIMVNLMIIIREECVLLLLLLQYVKGKEHTKASPHDGVVRLACASNTAPRRRRKRRRVLQRNKEDTEEQGRRVL